MGGVGGQGRIEGFARSGAVLRRRLGARPATGQPAGAETGALAAQPHQRAVRRLSHGPGHDEGSSMKAVAIGFAFLLALLCPPEARADEVVIKLGTLAPNGSTWHSLLKEMGQTWSQLSGGKVKLRIYPGGVVGNEGDMVKKMRVGQLQAAALTTIGLHEI